MKRTLAVVALLAGAVSGYSQGQVQMLDYLKSDFQISVWSPDTANPAVETQGNSSAAFATAKGTAADIPAGTTVYTGTPLGGNAADTGTSATDYGNGHIWSVQLYAGAGTVGSFSGLSAVSGSKANFFVDANNLGYAGSWLSTSSASVPGVPNGSPATMAIAAWYNGNGAYTSYAAAVAAGQPSGFSTLGTENLDGAPYVPPDLPAPGEPQTISGGITSFSLSINAFNSINPVPEPSTIALGVMGAAAFLMRLRRK